MKRSEIILILLCGLLLLVCFFYKTFFHGYIPFPGDLLVAEYNPWKTYSYLGYVPGSYPNKAQYFDVLRQLYPWKTVSLQTIFQGTFPFWNPYNFSGTPLFANFQSAVLYPLNIFYILPQKIGWTILIMLQPFLTFCFTYLFARKIKLSPLASLLSSISFSFSSFLSVWLEYNTIGQVIIWLPLTLLSLEHILENKTILWIIIFVFALSSGFLGGHPQIAVYIWIFSFFYGMHRIITLEKLQQRKKQAAWLIGFFIFPLGITAIQLLPGAELSMYAARVSHTYDTIIHKILIQPSQLIMMFVPDFFGNPATHNYWPQDTYIGKVTSIGIIPLFFALLTIPKWKNLLIRFFLGVIVVILVLTTNNPLSSMLYAFSLPIISSSAPTLTIFLFCFSLSILAGFGFEEFKNRTYSIKKILVWLGLPLVLLFILAITSHKDTLHGNIAFKNTLYAFGLAIIFLSAILVSFFKNAKLTILILLVVISTIDIWRSFEKFNPFVPKELVFPKAPILNYLQRQKGINRFLGFSNSSIEANFATQYGLYSPDGYDPLYPKWYGEFIQSSKDGKIHTRFTDQTRSDAIISPSTSEEFTTNPYRQKVISLLGISYILDRGENASTEKAFPINQFTQIYQQDGWKIYNNNKALPRVFLTSTYQLYNNTQDFSAKFFSPTFDSRQTLLLEKKPAMPIKSFAQGTVSLKRYTPNKVTITTNTTDTMLLFLSDTYYPGWNAFIDGKKTEILKADYAFRAVTIPAGMHEVSFTFNSLSFKIGSIVSIISLISFVFLLIIIKKKSTYV